MKDNTEHSEHGGQRSLEGQGPDKTLAELLPSYTPKQRKTVLKGLRILARAAIRVHMERRWPGSMTTPEADDRVEGTRTDE